MRKILLLIALSTNIFAQSSDTVKVDKIKILESKIDSLKQTLKIMDRQLQDVKKNLIEGKTNVESILSLFDENYEENIPEDQRSRKKRVDALLKAITERPGQVRFNGGATMSLQSFNLNNKTQTTGVGSFDLFAHSSFGKNTLLFIDIEAIGGNGPSLFFNPITNLNGDAGSYQSSDGIDRLNVLEAWAEFTMFEESLTLTLGKIDLSNYFDNNRYANDETLQFLGSSFVNSSAILFPSNSPGIRIRTTLFEVFYLQAGFAKIENTADNLFTGIFKMASIGSKFNLTSWFDGNMRVYVYKYPNLNKAYGYGISYDQEIFHNFGLFGRYTRNNESLHQNKNIESSYSFGLNASTEVLGKKAYIGAAYGKTQIQDSFNTSEKNAETYIRFTMNKWVNLSAHFQLYWDKTNTTHSFLGIRSNVNF